MNAPVDLIQPMRSLCLGTKLVSLPGNPALVQVGQLASQFTWGDDVILHSVSIQYCAGVFFLSAVAGDVDFAGAFITEGTTTTQLAINQSVTSADPGILWSRNDAFTGTAAANFNPVISASSDMQFGSKLLRAGTSMGLYLITPLKVTTQVNYGVQATFHYWTLDSYRNTLKNPTTFLASPR